MALKLAVVPVRSVDCRACTSDHNFRVFNLVFPGKKETDQEDPGRVATVNSIELNAIERFYRTHADAVYAFLVSLCRDPVWAEDLMQDTFVKATRSMGGYRGGNPRSWLFSIARSVFIDDTRRRRAVPVDEIEEKGVMDSDVAELILIERSLSKLPERQRTALLLADKAGLSLRGGGRSDWMLGGRSESTHSSGQGVVSGALHGDQRMNHEEAQELLEDYVDERLDRPVRDQLEEHLGGCSECRSILDGVAPVDLEALGSADVDERTLRRSVRRALWRTVIDAAGLLVLLVVGLWVISNLVVHPLLMDRGGRAAAVARATYDVAGHVQPGSVRG